MISIKKYKCPMFYLFFKIFIPYIFRLFNTTYRQVVTGVPVVAGVAQFGKPSCSKLYWRSRFYPVENKLRP